MLSLFQLAGHFHALLLAVQDELVAWRMQNQDRQIKLRCLSDQINEAGQSTMTHAEVERLQAEKLSAQKDATKRATLLRIELNRL